jgi:hypothetical protein
MYRQGEPDLGHMLPQTTALRPPRLPLLVWEQHEPTVPWDEVSLLYPIMRIRSTIQGQRSWTSRLQRFSFPWR